MHLDKLAIMKSLDCISLIPGKSCDEYADEFIDVYGGVPYTFLFVKLNELVPFYLSGTFESNYYHTVAGITIENNLYIADVLSSPRLQKQYDYSLDLVDSNRQLSPVDVIRIDLDASRLIVQCGFRYHDIIKNLNEQNIKMQIVASF